MANILFRKPQQRITHRVLELDFQRLQMPCSEVLRSINTGAETCLSAKEFFRAVFIGHLF